jgi:hypothetical protein
MAIGFTSKDDRDSWIKSIQFFRDRRLISKSSYSMQRTYLDLNDAYQCAERFKRLYSDYKALAIEEKSFNIEICGLDISNINTVFNYLQLDLLTQGMEHKLLAMLQALILIPSGKISSFTCLFGCLSYFLSSSVRSYLSCFLSFPCFLFSIVP